MALLQIEGGTPLQGHVRVSGAKNVVTKLLVASLLSNKKCRFTSVPDIGDVRVTVELCREIGALIEWDREEGVLETITPELKTSYIPQRFSGANRIPILMLGALLGRTNGEVIVPTVGGCDIGKRPVDFHVEALQKMGATIEHRRMLKESAWFAHAHDGLHGTVITLPYPSVGATENCLLAGSTATGTTVIKNAAMEPEVVELILFLQKMGVPVTIESDRTIRLLGTNRFYEAEHKIIPDRMEAASWATAAIATKGRIFVEGAEHGRMISFINKIRQIGGGFDIKEHGIEFFYTGSLQGGLHLETDVHPGFMTDWQQPFVVLLTQTQGLSIVHETVYENRFGYTDILREMGGDLTLFRHCLGGSECRFALKHFAHSLAVKGVTPLYGKEIVIPDLRAGFAYLLAALVASGKSKLSGLHFLERGYEKLDAKLEALGASFSREEERVPALEEALVN